MACPYTGRSNSRNTPIAVGSVGPCERCASANGSEGRPCLSCTTIESSGVSAVFAITSRPLSPTTTHRVPSSNTIGCPCTRRIWLCTPCGFSRSTSNAPSLNTLQF